jgi:hypothetical protein
LNPKCPIEQGSQGFEDGRDPNFRAYKEKLVEPNSRADYNSLILIGLGLQAAIINMPYCVI